MLVVWLVESVVRLWRVWLERRHPERLPRTLQHSGSTTSADGSPQRGLMTPRCGDRRHEDVLAIDLRAREGECDGCRDGGANRVHRGYGNVRSLT